MELELPAAAVVRGRGDGTSPHEAEPPRSSSSVSSGSLSPPSNAGLDRGAHIILSPRFPLASVPPSPSPSPSPFTSLASLFRPPSETETEPQSPRARSPSLDPPTIGALDRAQALQRFLERRLTHGLAATPPRELQDWRLLESEQNEHLEQQVQRLLRGTTPREGALPPPVGVDVDDDESDDAGALFYSTLRAGADSRQRRRRLLQAAVSATAAESAEVYGWADLDERERELWPTGLQDLGAAVEREEGDDDDDDDDQATVRASSVEQDVARATRLWRNDPIDISRGWWPPGLSTSSQTTQVRPPRQSLFESADEVELRRRSQAPPPTYQRELDSFRLSLPPASTTSDFRAPPALASDDSLHSLDWTFHGRPRVTASRAKRGCMLLYCGKPEERLPKGFHGAPREGCGKLVCSRALRESPSRIFEQDGDEEQAFSTDLPPVANVVGDVGRATGESVGCTDCRTRSFGCLACGHVLGFRILRACPACQKTRALAADALLFHFRGSSVTARPRLPSIPDSTLPPPSITPEPTDAEEPLRWLQLPAPQADWASGLVGEPSDWIDSDDEWWWVRHGFGRQCRRLERGERHGASPAVYTVPPRDSIDAVFSQRVPINSFARLSRSFAVRVPPPPTDARRRSMSPPPRRVRRRLDNEVEDVGEARRKVLEGAGYGTMFAKDGERPRRVPSARGTRRRPLIGR